MNYKNEYSIKKETYFEQLKKSVLNILHPYRKTDFLIYDKKILDNKEKQKEIFILCVNNNGTDLITVKHKEPYKLSTIYNNKYFFLCQDEKIKEIPQEEVLFFIIKKRKELLQMDLR